MDIPWPITALCPKPLKHTEDIGSPDGGNNIALFQNL